MHCVFWVQVAVCCSGWQCTQWFRQYCFAHFSLGCGYYVAQLSNLGCSCGQLAENWFFCLFCFVWTNYLLKQELRLPSTLRQTQQRGQVGSPSLPWNETIYDIFYILASLGIYSPGLHQPLPSWCQVKFVDFRTWDPGVVSTLLASRQMLRPETWVIATWLLSSHDMFWETKIIAEHESICESTFPSLTQEYYHEL